MGATTARVRIDYRRPRGEQLGGAVNSLATVDSSATLTPRTRQAEDFYREPAIAVDALIGAEEAHGGFPGTSFDPACGLGNIPDTMTRRGYLCGGSDIVDRGWRRDGPYGDLWLGAADFLKNESAAANIVTNPPFKLAEAFIAHSLTPWRLKVAMLLRLSFLEGQGRAAMFKAHPPARVWVFSWRISMPPGDVAVEAKGGAVAFAWFVWDRHHKGPAQLGWLERP